MSEWKTYKLGDVAETRKEQIISNGEEQPYIGLEHIEQQSLRLNGVGSSNDVISNKFKFYSGDILYGRLRPYFRKVYKPNFDGVCSTEIFVIKPKKDINKDFLFYLVATEEFTNMANSGSSGTHMPRADWKQLEKSEWNIPSLPTQTQIAQILTSLDDKIELNLQMNQTLEAMAQALFKEWFVNFNFPSSELGLEGLNDDRIFHKKGKKENKEILPSSNQQNHNSDNLPKGWRMGKLSEVIEIKHGYAFKGEFFSDFEEDDILITPGNFKNGGGFNSQKFKYYNGDVPNDYILNKNDLIVTMTDLSKAGDTLGYSALVPTIDGKRLLHNQRIGKVIFKSDLPIKYFLYWLMRQYDYRHFVLGSATGSTVKHTSPTRICEFQFPLPTKELLTKFETKIGCLSEKAQENEVQIQTLTQTRDTLLPKLMSGKIKLSELGLGGLNDDRILVKKKQIKKS